MRVLDENEVNMLCCGDDGDVEALDGETDAEHRVTLRIRAEQDIAHAIFL